MTTNPSSASYFSDSKSVFWTFLPLLVATWTGWSAYDGTLAHQFQENERSLASAWQQDLTGAGYINPLAQLVHETPVGFDVP